MPKAYKLRQWKSFDEARQFARLLKLAGHLAWKEYSQSGKRPKDIPSNPHIKYKEQWEGWADFLGYYTRRPAPKKIYRSFSDARTFARSLKFHSVKQWQVLNREGLLPTDIPMAADRVYAKEWQGWSDFLGSSGLVPKIWRPNGSSETLSYWKQLQDEEQARVLSRVKSRDREES
jgi:muconolactone delta-isomerase